MRFSPLNAIAFFLNKKLKKIFLKYLNIILHANGLNCHSKVNWCELPAVNKVLLKWEVKAHLYKQSLNAFI